MVHTIKYQHMKLIKGEKREKKNDTHAACLAEKYKKFVICKQFVRKKYLAYKINFDEF
jgi:hypothetical protein